MNDLQDLRPFSEGNAHESATGMVRIYDRTGFPRIEIYMNDPSDDLDAIAQQVREALNNGPDATGP